MILEWSEQEVNEYLQMLVTANSPVRLFLMFEDKVKKSKDKEYGDLEWSEQEVNEYLQMLVTANTPVRLFLMFEDKVKKAKDKEYGDAGEPKLKVEKK